MSSITYLTEQQAKREEIKQLLTKIVAARLWCQKDDRHRAKRYEVHERIQPTIKRLEELGVRPSFSASLFFFGFQITPKLLGQVYETCIKQGALKEEGLLDFIDF